MSGGRISTIKSFTQISSNRICGHFHEWYYVLMYLVIDNEIVAKSDSEADLVNFATVLDCDYEIVENTGGLPKAFNFKRI